MEKIIQYKKIVSTVFEEIHALFPKEEGIDNQIIIDENRGHYLLYAVGWEQQNWVYDSYAHIDVKSDGKVWLQHDGTDMRIGDMLLERGILAQDMVVGFQPPYARALMENFALS